MNNIKVTYYEYEEAAKRNSKGELEEIAYIDIEDGIGCCIIELPDGVKLCISTMEDALISLVK